MRRPPFLLALASLAGLAGGTADLSNWLQAACQGDVSNLEASLNNGQKIEEESHSGHTALLYAVMHNRLYAAQYLLDQGADPRAVTKARAPRASCSRHRSRRRSRHRSRRRSRRRRSRHSHRRRRSRRRCSRHS